MDKEKEQSEIHYVGMNMRLFASMVDVTLLIMAMLLLDPVLKMVSPFIHSLLGVVIDLSAYNAAIIHEKRVLMILKIMHEYGVLYRLVVDIMMSFVLYSFMILPFWILKSATPGKMLICARIVDARTMDKPSTLKFIIRYVAYLVSLIPAGFGLFWCTLNARRRAWHDVIAGTLVIYDSDGWVIRLAARLNRYFPRPSSAIDFYKKMIAKVRK